MFDSIVIDCKMFTYWTHFSLKLIHKRTLLLNEYGGGGGGGGQWHKMEKMENYPRVFPFSP